jgi:hypothetical protein
MIACARVAAAILAAGDSHRARSVFAEALQPWRAAEIGSDIARSKTLAE